jgi:hypothetical protein
MKDRWITITLATTCAFGSVFLGNFLVNKNAKAASYDAQIKELNDKKLDKFVFDKHEANQVVEQKNSEDRIIKYMDQRFDDVIKILGK